MTGLYGANAPTLVSQPPPSSTNLLPTQQQPPREDAGIQVHPTKLGKDSLLAKPKLLSPH